eukprot:5561825-Prymnesium_polylepis.2
MGGAIERIVILPLIKGQGELERKAEARSVLNGLLRFDAAKARCFKPEDQQKLLAVIEVGFGSFVPFNRMVRE